MCIGETEISVYWTQSVFKSSSTAADEMHSRSFWITTTYFYLQPSEEYTVMLI